MQTPQEVLVMRQLLERGWSRRRIAAELGLSRTTLDRYLRLSEWQPYSTANRSGQLDGHREWLQQQFEQHHGTTGERPLERFERAEAGALMALNGKPSYLAEQEFSRRVAKHLHLRLGGAGLGALQGDDRAVHIHVAAEEVHVF